MTKRAHLVWMALHIAAVCAQGYLLGSVLIDGTDGPTFFFAVMLAGNAYYAMRCAATIYDCAHLDGYVEGCRDVAAKRREASK